MKEAARLYNIGQNPNELGFKHARITNSLESFGAAMHTVMDNMSPSHSGFQVYDNRATAAKGAIIGGLIAGPIGAVVGAGANVVGGNIQHAQGEGHLGGEREPTVDEENAMVDEMRSHYRQVYGEKAYEQAVSQEQREQTAGRLARNGTGSFVARP